MGNKGELLDFTPHNYHPKRCKNKGVVFFLGGGELKLCKKKEVIKSKGELSDFKHPSLQVYPQKRSEIILGRQNDVRYLCYGE